MKLKLHYKGGPGSGFEGHSGRPGEVGGSSGKNGTVRKIIAPEEVIRARSRIRVLARKNDINNRISAHRNNLLMWHEDMDWDKPLKSWGQIITESVKNNDIRLISRNVAIDPTRPLGSSKNVYEIQLARKTGWKTLRDVPETVYELYQSLKQESVDIGEKE